MLLFLLLLLLSLLYNVDIVFVLILLLLLLVFYLEKGSRVTPEHIIATCWASYLLLRMTIAVKVVVVGVAAAAPEDDDKDDDDVKDDYQDDDDNSAVANDDNVITTDAVIPNKASDQKQVDDVCLSRERVQWSERPNSILAWAFIMSVFDELTGSVTAK